jgi:2-polyprenyl-6-methoxyphenol hydroxylase-like FAD-dependent oxidoreductase
MSLRVVVVGAGLGGLALAQGLRRRGVEVAVYERDRTPADRLQGYRLHINADGSRALHDCLPPELFEAFVATCGQPNTGIGIYTHRLRQLAWFGGDPGTVLDPVDNFKSVSRVSLRHVLLAGLDEVVHFDQAFTHYEITPQGQVAAHFTSGVAFGDVLVGADGGGSRVRKQYLPQADRIDTGMRGIQGKVWLDDEVRERVPERLFEGPIMIPGAGGYGMFLALHQFQPIPPGVERYVSAEAAQQRDYVMWGLLARAQKFPPGLAHLEAEGLRDVAVEATRRWHPTLQHLVRSSDLDTVLLTPIRSAVPVEPRTPSRVTLMGDAVHSMPPTGGIGANTALRDAALLSSQLAAASEGRIDVVEAISVYEVEMRRYGFEAVASSMRNLRRQQRTENPLVLAGMKAALRIAGALPAVRHRALS